MKKLDPNLRPDEDGGPTKCSPHDQLNAGSRELLTPSPPILRRDESPTSALNQEDSASEEPGKDFTTSLSANCGLHPKSIRFDLPSSDDRSSRGTRGSSINLDVDYKYLSDDGSKYETFRSENGESSLDNDTLDKETKKDPHGTSEEDEYTSLDDMLKGLSALNAELDTGSYEFTNLDDAATALIHSSASSRQTMDEVLSQLSQDYPLVLPPKTPPTPVHKGLPAWWEVHHPDKNNQPEGQDSSSVTKVVRKEYKSLNAVKKSDHCGTNVSAIREQLAANTHRSESFCRYQPQESRPKALRCSFKQVQSFRNPAGNNDKEEEEKAVQDPKERNNNESDIVNEAGRKNNLLKSQVQRDDMWIMKPSTPKKKDDWNMSDERKRNTDIIAQIKKHAIFRQMSQHGLSPVLPARLPQELNSKCTSETEDKTEGNVLLGDTRDTRDTEVGKNIGNGVRGQWQGNGLKDLKEPNPQTKTKNHSPNVNALKNGISLKDKTQVKKSQDGKPVNGNLRVEEKRKEVGLMDIWRSKGLLQPEECEKSTITTKFKAIQEKLAKGPSISLVESKVRLLSASFVPFGLRHKVKVNTPNVPEAPRNIPKGPGTTEASDQPKAPMAEEASKCTPGDSMATQSEDDPKDLMIVEAPMNDLKDIKKDCAGYTPNSEGPDHQLMLVETIMKTLPKEEPKSNGAHVQTGRVETLLAPEVDMKPVEGKAKDVQSGTQASLIQALGSELLERVPGDTPAGAEVQGVTGSISEALGDRSGEQDQNTPSIESDNLEPKQHLNDITETFEHDNEGLQESMIKDNPLMFDSLVNQGDCSLKTFVNLPHVVEMMRMLRGSVETM